jgi:hypothetical protein
VPVLSSNETNEREEHNANDWDSMSLLMSLLDCHELSKGILYGTKLVSEALLADLSANDVNGTIASGTLDETEGFFGSATCVLDGCSDNAALEEGLSAVDASIDLCLTGSPSVAAHRASDFSANRICEVRHDEFVDCLSEA